MVKAYYSSVLGRYTTQDPSTIVAPSSGSSGSTYTEIAPPDDRYYPGVSITEADGDVKSIGPRLKELAVVASTYGLAIPITFGVRRLNGNIIWSLPLTEKKNGQKSGGGGGKGGDSGSTTKTTTYSYYGTFAVSFGYPNPIDQGKRDLIRVWLDGTMVLDKRGLGKSQIRGLIYNFYPGTQTQVADPIMKKHLGAANVPAYRGQMILVIENLPLEAFGNRIPMVTVEVGDATTASSTNVTLGTSANAVNALITQPHVDFLRRRAFVICNENPDVIDHYDIDSNTFLMRVPTTRSDIAEDSCYAPWLGKLICATSEGGTGVGLAAIDVFTGQQTHHKGIVFGSATLTQSKLMPFFTIGMAGIQTYLLNGGLFNEVSITRMSDTLQADGQGTFEPIFLKDVLGGSGDMIGGAAGRIGIGATEVFIAGLTKVHKVTVSENCGPIGAVMHATPGIVFKQDFYTAPANILMMHYYAPDDTLVIIDADERVTKIDAQTGTVLIQTASGQNIGPTVIGTRSYQSDVSRGYWPVQGDSGGISEINMLTLEVINYTTPVTSMSGHPIADSMTRSMIGGTGGSNDILRHLYYDRLADERMTLANYIKGVATLAGFNVATEISVDANITDVIDGAIITEVTDFRSVLMNLAPLYRLDIIESEGKIKIVRKAADSSPTDFAVTEAELSRPSSSSGDTPIFRMRREQEVTVPERVIVKYIDKSLGYKWNTAIASRSRQIETNKSDNQITYQVFIVMTAQEAKEAANKALWFAWNARTTYEFLLPQKFLDLEPSDVGTVQANGITYNVRAVEVSYNADFTIGVQAHGYLTDFPVAIVADPGAGYTQTIPTLSLSQIIVLDIPLIYAQADLSVIAPGAFPLHIFVAPFQTTAWPGGVGYMARDLLTWSDIATNTADGLVGNCTNVLGVPVDAYATDVVNTLTIYPTGGQTSFLASVTETEFLEKANMAAVGAHGRWELICFRDVTANADGSFTLSRLLRGQKGTDHNCGNHAVGDTFVLLDLQWIQTTGLVFSDLGKSIGFKAVGFNQHIDEVVPKAHIIEGNGGAPWPPGNVQMQGEADGDIVVSWQRRSRIHGDWVDEAETIPLTTYEANDYLVTVYRNFWIEDGSPDINHPDGETVAFTKTVTGATQVTLTNAEIDNNNVNHYIDPVSSIDTPSHVNPENPFGLADKVNPKYIYVKVQQKSLMTGLSYGPGRKEKIFVRRP